MLWNRNTRGEWQPVPDPGPDLHPAQIDLLEAQRRQQAAIAALDDGLRVAGNARPTMRDHLLDARFALGGTP